MSVPWPVQVDIIAAFSLLGFILVCIPLYWHLEGTLSTIAFVSVRKC